jgi:hypothetical protein
MEPIEVVFAVYFAIMILIPLMVVASIAFFVFALGKTRNTIRGYSAQVRAESPHH